MATTKKTMTAGLLAAAVVAAGATLMLCHDRQTNQDKQRIDDDTRAERTAFLARYDGEFRVLYIYAAVSKTGNYDHLMAVAAGNKPNTTMLNNRIEVKMRPQVAIPGEVWKVVLDEDGQFTLSEYVSYDDEASWGPFNKKKVD